MEFLSSLAGLALFAWVLDPALKCRAVFNGKRDQRAWRHLSGAWAGPAFPVGPRFENSPAIYGRVIVRQHQVSPVRDERTPSSTGCAGREENDNVRS
jgi:hypothetical protein